MGIFGKKSFKVAFLSGNGLFRYQIDEKYWDELGLSKCLVSLGNDETAVNGRHEFIVYLMNERETAGRHIVNIVGPSGQIASVNDSDLWIVIVRSVEKMRLSGVQTRCRLIIDLTGDLSTTEVRSMNLDLPSGFSGDLTNSPDFQIIEVQE